MNIFSEESYEYQYINALEHCMENGFKQVNSRTGEVVRRIPHVVFTVDLQNDIPALQTKKLFTKSATQEILWIMQKQSNNIKDLEPNIWDSWADENGSIGKAYGYQIRPEYKPKKINVQAKSAEPFKDIYNNKKHIKELKVMDRDLGGFRYFDKESVPFTVVLALKNGGYRIQNLDTLDSYDVPREEFSFLIHSHLALSELDRGIKVRFFKYRFSIRQTISTQVLNNSELRNRHNEIMNRIGVNYCGRGFDFRVISVKIKDNNLEDVDYKIQFNDTGYCTWITENNLLNKNLILKDPFNRATYWDLYMNIGYLGVPSKESEYIRENFCILTSLWVNMLKECYTVDGKLKSNKYVCERWHNFYNFAEDFRYIEGYTPYLNLYNCSVSVDYYRSNVFRLDTVIIAEHEWYTDNINNDLTKINSKYETTSLPINQISELIRTMKTDPTSRRMVLDLWNAREKAEMNLEPCCYSSIFDIVDNTLHCTLIQRSGDSPVGVPFNTYQYSVLTYILAKECGLKVGQLTHVIADFHIYENQVIGVQEQIDRYNLLSELNKLFTNFNIRITGKDSELLNHNLSLRLFNTVVSYIKDEEFKSKLYEIDLLEDKWNLAISSEDFKNGLEQIIKIATQDFKPEIIVDNVSFYDLVADNIHLNFKYNDGTTDNYISLPKIEFKVTK